MADEGQRRARDEDLGRLALLLRRERKAILDRWREQVRLLPSAQELAKPVLDDHIPSFLDELAAALASRADETIPEALVQGSPGVHGLQRHADGFDIVEVVAEYNILRGCVQDLAEANSIVLRGTTFHILNRVLDEAIGVAVQTFATQQALQLQRRREEHLAFVAHDLRTPLGAIALAARVLENSLSGHMGARETSMMTALDRNVRQLKSLVEEILKETDHVRTETGLKLERRVFDLWPLVESLIVDLNPVAGTASTQLRNEVPEDMAVFADAILLKRVLQNLIANAIKYTPRGAVVIGARATGHDVECWVVDNGAGIPEGRLPEIFDRLESDSPSDDGMGLGLAIVRTFVEAHGGTIGVESREGSGSTFRFTLPGKGMR